MNGFVKYDAEQIFNIIDDLCIMYAHMKGIKASEAMRVVSANLEEDSDYMEEMEKLADSEGGRNED